MLKNNKNIRNRLLIILSLPFVIFIIVGIYNGFSKLHKSFDNEMPSLHLITKEDSGLIADKYRSKLTPDIIYQRTHRKPISFIVYDSNYNLIIYRIDSTNMSLNNQFKLISKKMEITVDEVYNVVNLHNFKFQYSNSTVKPVTEIYFSLIGDALRIINKNDSIVSYSFLP